MSSLRVVSRGWAGGRNDDTLPVPLVDRGVRVDAHLETSAPGIYAAGDLATFPYLGSGEPVRIEHWVVAQRMGAVAAANMLGARQAFIDVPFFWTSKHDLQLSFVGHSESRPITSRCRSTETLVGATPASATARAGAASPS